MSRVEHRYWYKLWLLENEPKRQVVQRNSGAELALSLFQEATASIHDNLRIDLAIPGPGSKERREVMAAAADELWGVGKHKKWTVLRRFPVRKFVEREKMSKEDRIRKDDEDRSNSVISIPHTWGHLDCFIGGTLILGSGAVDGGSTSTSSAAVITADLELGLEITKTCVDMYLMNLENDATGLACDGVVFTDNEAPHCAHSGSVWFGRPETIESLFYAWRATRDVAFRKAAAMIFRSMRDNTRADRFHAGEL